MAATTISTTGHCPGRADGAASGFTLFELVMVLMLLAVLLGAAVPRMRGFAVGRADADAADSVLAMTRMARDLAATNGTVSRLNFDFQAGGYWLTVQQGGKFVEPGTSDSRPQVLPSGMGVKLDLPPEVEQRPYVQFMPDGRAEEAMISLICRDGDVYRVCCPSATDTFRVIKPTEYQP